MKSYARNDGSKAGSTGTRLFSDNSEQGEGGSERHKKPRVGFFGGKLDLMKPYKCRLSVFVVCPDY